ncbi:MAG: CopG family transcriptional regulator [Tepidiformaceae bacterium]
MKTIQMTIDEPLLEQLDREASRENMARSALIRVALVAELRRRRQTELERQDREAYRLHPQTAEELAEVDEWMEIQDWGDD